jgi:hypothetical protein
MIAPTCRSGVRVSTQAVIPSGYTSPNDVTPTIYRSADAIIEPGTYRRWTDIIAAASRCLARVLSSFGQPQLDPLRFSRSM